MLTMLVVLTHHESALTRDESASSTASPRPSKPGTELTLAFLLGVTPRRREFQRGIVPLAERRGCPSPFARLLNGDNRGPINLVRARGEAMTWGHVVAGSILSIGTLAVVPALRWVYLWSLKHYEEATQTAFLLLVIYALLSAPILVAWMVGVKP
jgi:hypothetical protein